MILLKAADEKGSLFIFHPSREMDSIFEKDENEELYFNSEVSSDEGKSLDLKKTKKLGFETLELPDLFEKGFENALSEDMHEIDTGIYLLEAALSVYSEVPNAWLGLGFAYKMKEDYKKAVQSLEKIFDLPEEVFEEEKTKKVCLIALYRDLVYCYGKLGQHEKSLELAIKGYEVASDDIGIVMNLANSYAETGQFKTARKYFIEAAELDPGDPQIQQLLAAAEKIIKEKKKSS